MTNNSLTVAKKSQNLVTTTESLTEVHEMNELISRKTGPKAFVLHESRKKAKKLKKEALNQHKSNKSQDEIEIQKNSSKESSNSSNSAESNNSHSVSPEELSRLKGAIITKGQQLWFQGKKAEKGALIKKGVQLLQAKGAGKTLGNSTSTTNNFATTSNASNVGKGPSDSSVESGLTKNNSNSDKSEHLLQNIFKRMSSSGGNLDGSEKEQESGEFDDDNYHNDESKLKFLSPEDQEDAKIIASWEANLNSSSGPNTNIYPNCLDISSAANILKMKIPEHSIIIEGTLQEVIREVVVVPPEETPIKQQLPFVNYLKSAPIQTTVTILNSSNLKNQNLKNSSAALETTTSTGLNFRESYDGPEIINNLSEQLSEEESFDHENMDQLLNFCGEEAQREELEEEKKKQREEMEQLQREAGLVVGEEELEEEELEEEEEEEVLEEKEKEIEGMHESDDSLEDVDEVCLSEFSESLMEEDEWNAGGGLPGGGDSI